MASSPTRASRYDEGCAAGFALGLVGDRWALLVVRELMLAPKRFQAIRAGLPGITPSVLSGRLTDLMASGLVEHHSGFGLYSLTPAGRDLRPVLYELGRWGAGRPGHDPRKFVSPSSLMLSLAVMIDRDKPRPTGWAAGFDLGAESFDVSFDDAGEPVPVAVATPSSPLVFTGSTSAIGAVLYTRTPVAVLVADGGLEVGGDVAGAQAFADAFIKLG